ncbi:MAG: DUF1223 domain-containing protein [Pseudomonadota bacterium]
MSRLPRTLELAVTALLLAAGASAGPQPQDVASQVFSTGGKQVALLELYTSEGCSSCPPADRWLSARRDDPELWKSYVPLAFHVDYWNYLGWKDRFAQPAYSDRQRRYIEEDAARVVYTPGFFSAGKEWLGWRNGRGVQAGDGDGGALTATVLDGAVAIHYVPATDARGGFEINVALLGMGIESEVAAGENRGRRLQHDFIVLEHRRLPLERRGAGYAADTDIAPADEAATGYALAVWVSARGTQRPLQATGGFLEPKPATRSAAARR